MAEPIQFESEVYTPDLRRRVFGLCHLILRNPADAEDVSQDVFLTAWEKLHTYDAQRGAVQTWLFNMARSRAIDFARHRSYTVSLDSAQPGSDEAGIFEIEAPGLSLEWRVFLLDVAREMNALDSQLRLPMELAIEGYGSAEIGAALGVVSALMVRKRVHQAREALRARLA